MATIITGGKFNTFDNQQPDRVYNSFDFTQDSAFVSNGVIPLNRKDNVITATGRAITINEGTSIIQGHTAITLAPIQEQLSGISNSYAIVVLGVSRNSSGDIIDEVDVSRSVYWRIEEGGVSESISSIIQRLSNETLTNNAGKIEMPFAILQTNANGDVERIIDTTPSAGNSILNTLTTSYVEYNSGANEAYVYVSALPNDLDLDFIINQTSVPQKVSIRLYVDGWGEVLDNPDTDIFIRFIVGNEIKTYPLELFGALSDETQYLFVLQKDKDTGNPYFEIREAF